MIAGLLLLQVATLTAVHLAGERTLRQMVAEELRVGGRVLDRVLASRGRQLSDAVRVLAADFAFREAIASSDRPTITSVLLNHGARLAADATFLTDLDGTVVADTLEDGFVGQRFPFPWLVEEALATGEASAIASFRNVPFQLVAVPVLAPDPIALVCMGFGVDLDVLAEVARLTSLDVTVWSPTAGSEPILLSTTDPRFLDDLLEHARTLEGSTARGRGLRLGPESYEVLLHEVETAASGSTVSALLKRSMDEARRPFRRLELQIAALSSVALVAAVAFAIFFARSVSRPLHALADGADRIARGEYGASVRVDRGDEIGMLAVAFNRMGAEIAEREERIRHQATHDALTGLPNRVLFLDRLAHAIVGARRRGSLVGMLMMDLDRFKEINDTIGHQFGDELLVEVGRRLAGCTRETDTVARFGGDEFAILFETEDASNALEIARRTARALEQPFEVGGITMDVKASIGIALYPDHADDADTLMKRSDVAMYDAKRGHQDLAVYESSRDEHSLRRLAILSELRNAIADEQLDLHYQPMIALSAERVVHVEALARWRHPVYGMIPPAEFVPLAEQTGNIGALTHWVLRRAIADCANWNRSGQALAVSVNLSALDLYDSDLPERIGRWLDERGLPPSRLVLEITESAVMKDAAHAVRTLEMLKSRGVVLAIDDFGTGYSSLGHLKRLRVDQLKIDRSFVARLGDESTQDGFIVRSAIELGHNMGLTVVAEGVEDETSWRLLKELGCDLAQGYFISRPLPGDRLLEWLRESRWGTD